MVAGGLILSSITYIIQVYGGCTNYLLDSLQVQLNRAARTVTKLSKFTPTSDLMRQCNWMTVRQLVAYHSLVVLHRVMTTKSPTYIFNLIKLGGRLTRHVDNTTASDERRFKTVTANRGFVPRTVKDWNMLPVNIRSISEHSSFKRHLKDYILNQMTS